MHEIFECVIALLKPIVFNVQIHSLIIIASNKILPPPSYEYVLYCRRASWSPGFVLDLLLTRYRRNIAMMTEH